MVSTDKDLERVLVVPRSAIERLGMFQGFCGEAERYLTELLRPELAGFCARGECETDPSLKQIIPYVVFRSGDRVFCYTRGQSQGEARLHALRSLGVGGHVAEEDADGKATLDAYQTALERELVEEVHVGSPGVMSLAGLINDDATPVGSVHLGVVHVVELERPEMSAREEGLAGAEFLPLERVRQLRDEFETWSQIVIDALLAGER
jgi:predicted NUDIX family phosphoesterase